MARLSAAEASSPAPRACSSVRASSRLDWRRWKAEIAERARAAAPAGAAAPDPSAHA
jgi:hypothetical protein